jgi:hypothetical protein
MFPPTANVLQGLFRNPSMFNSYRDWRKAGFEVTGRGEESNIMVASHPSAPGVLFKKYSKKISLKKQRKNYQRRIAGAEKLRKFVAAQRLTKIVVPQKRLHELSSEFSRKDEPAYVLVVERLPLLESTASKRLYHEIDRETLRQLCAVLLEFRGLDSGVRNVPFTSKGQVAFIDTERWDEHRESKIWLRRIREYLSSDQRKIADALRSK